MSRRNLNDRLLAARELLSSGLSPAEVAREALQRFGVGGAEVGGGQPGWMPGGNLPAARAAGQTFSVAKKTLRFPRAEGGMLNPLNWVKYALGQRQYLP